MTGFLVSFAGGGGTPGAPVVNEYGELVGMIGDSGVAGATELIDQIHLAAAQKGIPVLLASSVRVPATPQPQTIAELQAKGELVLPLTGAESVVSGGFAKQIVKGNTVQPADQRDVFSTSEPSLVAFLSWSPVERLRGVSRISVYDSVNRLLMESQPGKLDIPKARLVLSSWQLPVPKQPGAYRIDVLLNDKPIWRGFIRVTS